MEFFRIARDAMATRFEIAISGKDEVYLRSSAEEALDEIVRLERTLSYFDPKSEIAEINRNGSKKWVRVNPETFHLIKRCVEISAQTDGYFDIAVSPLINLWKSATESQQMPQEKDIQELLQASIYQNIQLDESNFSIRFTHPQSEINLGSVGKGFAIQNAYQILLDMEIESGLIQGGTSSMIGWGLSPMGMPWKIAIQKPNQKSEIEGQLLSTDHADEHGHLLGIEELASEGESLSVSSIWGQGYSIGEQYLGHVIDPVSGYPVIKTELTAVIHKDPFISETLSTALLAGGKESLITIEPNYPEIRGLLYAPNHNDSVFKI